MKTVHYAAATREGVRFHFSFDPVWITACDLAGKPIDGVAVEIIGRERVSVRCGSLGESAQEGTKALKQNDEILSVAGIPLNHVGALAAALKAQPPGSNFTVRYRSVLDGHEREFVARGGRPLGIHFFEIFPGMGK